VLSFVIREYWFSMRPLLLLIHNPRVQFKRPLNPWWKIEPPLLLPTAFPRCRRRISSWF